MIPPWADKSKRYTYLFESYVILLLQMTKNQTATAKITNIGFNVINRIMHGAAERGMSRRELDHDQIRHLSLEKKSFRKGHNYISVLSSPSGNGLIIDVVNDRTTKSAQELLKNSLDINQLKNIKTVSMDMWKAYIKAVQDTLPDAEIIHDRFHLVKYLNQSIDKVRRREVKTNEGLLKNSRYALLKNQENLTDNQKHKFECIAKTNLSVSKAWLIKENFIDIYKYRGEPITCLALFNQWTKSSLSTQIKEVSKVVTMFQNNISGVVNSMIYNLSNAMAERINGKIQILKSIARGYRTFKNFRSAILFFYGDLDVYPLK